MCRLEIKFQIYGGTADISLADGVFTYKTYMVYSHIHSGGKDGMPLFSILLNSATFKTKLKRVRHSRYPLGAMN